MNGALSNMLIGIDTSGTLYAFNAAGQLQNIFRGGASSIATGAFNATGLSFSTVDSNLWRFTNNRQLDAGHGLPAGPDGSNTQGNSRPVAGGSSLFFGPYNYFSGAAGAVESQPFDLSGVSAGSLPTLYFNYFLQTENASFLFQNNVTNNTRMRDAFRVYVSGEDGQWELVATNNSASSSSPDDLDEYDVGENVQQLFDNTNQWRQARVPLDRFAGQANVKLRVEFSSAGSFGFGVNGGKGPQLRMKSGDRLTDGSTLSIANKTYEIKTGPVLSLPAGAVMTPGDSITIEGVNYIFNDGSLTIASPNVEVPFSKTMSAAQLAAALEQQVRNATRPKTSISLTATEGNDTLTSATRGPTNGDSTVVTISGRIGDNPLLSDPAVAETDVDLVRVELNRGTTLVARVNAASLGSSLDSYLRLFDKDGNELRNNDNAPNGNTTDSEITFTVPEDGVYYLGVTGAGNVGYRPAVFGTANGGDEGPYQLVLDITRGLSPVANGARVQLEGAAHVSLPANSPILLNGSTTLANSTNIPIYVNIGMTADQVGLAVQNAFQRAYGVGTIVPFTVRGDTVDLTGVTTGQVVAGPFGLTETLPGDQFGSFGQQFGMRTGANNGFEGAYIDDFMIGLAGRGEMVSNAPADTTFVPVNANPDPTKILQGPYQLEIRGATEYGVPQRDNPSGTNTLSLVSGIGAFDRLVNGISVTFKDTTG